MKWKNLFSVKSEILGQLVKTLTANYEYSRSNRDNLLLPTETELSEKVSIFCHSLIGFSESTLNFVYFQTEQIFITRVISEDIECQRRAYLNA